MLPAPSSPLNTAGVFRYTGGSAETQVDCGKAGTVVTAGFRSLSTNDPYTTDPRYYAERRTYRVTGTRFRQVAATVLPNGDRGQAEGLLLSRGETRPFPSCAVSRFLI
jgi:hypothetical protein